jgi:hemerythrin
MAFLEWHESYSVGIKQFDQEHARLMQLINVLHEAMRTDKAPKIMFGFLIELKKYAETHFDNEERLLTQFNFPDIQAHRNEHLIFFEKVQKYQFQLEHKKIPSAMPLMAFLTDWLTRHIMRVDKKYGPFLNGHGVN